MKNKSLGPTLAHLLHLAHLREEVLEEVSSVDRDCSGPVRRSSNAEILRELREAGFASVEDLTEAVEQVTSVKWAHFNVAIPLGDLN